MSKNSTSLKYQGPLIIGRKEKKKKKKKGVGHHKTAECQRKKRMTVASYIVVKRD